MCQIAYCEKRKPTEDEIKNWWSFNNDGAGVAWNDGMYVYYRKGIMELKELMKEIDKLSLPFVIHFRLASVGTKHPELTHPFIISKDLKNPLQYRGKEAVIMHNGHCNEVLNIFYTLCFLEKRKIPSLLSDTRAIAYLLATHYQNTLLFLKNEKIAIITPKKIKLLGNFKEDKGVYTSQNFSRYYEDIETYYTYSFAVNKNIVK